ncbi:hypothetical protein ACFQ6N_22515 [Kitasatospora sp. NPDC056446]|uniref:hypothetical protein n=1 Tax=Kitasatospora sp. NPDC056446 TaxID=3345819 RepID=UPI0036786EA9
MYLVHAVLRPPAPGVELPSGVPEFIRATADPREPVEHVSVHPRADSTTVLGLFLIADRLADAERRAGEACLRAVGSMPVLDGWTVTRAEAPLITPLHEWLLSSYDPSAGAAPGAVGGAVPGAVRGDVPGAASGQAGRNCPGPNPSSR